MQKQKIWQHFVKKNRPILTNEPSFISFWKAALLSSTQVAGKLKSKDQEWEHTLGSISTPFP